MASGKKKLLAEIDGNPALGKYLESAGIFPPSPKVNPKGKKPKPKKTEEV